MNPGWTEGKLEFDFSGAGQTEKPDTQAAPLKSVDFWARYMATWVGPLQQEPG